MKGTFERLEDGIIRISEPQRFEGGEEEYDVSIGGAHYADLLKSGRGAFQLIAHYVQRPLEDILEIGAGSGTCSLGLVDAAKETNFLLTDTSAVFLNMIRKKLAAADINGDRVEYATLSGEDMHKLPENSFDAIVIASALHHISDWKLFIAVSRKILREGGVLVIQEPCREGNLMMGLALEFALSKYCRAAFGDDDVGRMTRLRDSIYLLANSDMKIDGEDKYSFAQADLIQAGMEAGFRDNIFYANFHFSDLHGIDLSTLSKPCSLIQYFGSFLEHHHKISPEGMSAFKEKIFPLMKGIDNLFMKGDGVPIMGSMVFR